MRGVGYTFIGVCPEYHVSTHEKLIVDGMRRWRSADQEVCRDWQDAREGVKRGTAEQMFFCGPRIGIFSVTHSRLNCCKSLICNMVPRAGVEPARPEGEGF